MTIISVPGVFLSFALLIPPLAAMFWFKVPLARDAVFAVARMILQLLFVGVYLGVIFEYNNPWLTALWIGVMMSTTDLAVLRGAGLRFKVLGAPLLLAIAIGTVVSAGYILVVVLQSSPFGEARITLPICGMLLGNCLNSSIIGLRAFYGSIRAEEKRFLFSISQGATLHEALNPYLSRAICESTVPLIASMASTGLVALPGMMTGVILGGASPVEAVKYQLLILLGIFSSTVLTVVCAVLLSIRKAFTPFGLLRSDVFR